MIGSFDEPSIVVVERSQITLNIFSTKCRNKPRWLMPLPLSVPENEFLQMVEKPINVRSATGDDEQESETLREYDDGTKLIGVTLVDEKTWTTGTTGYHDRYRIVAPSGQSRDLVGGMNMDRRRVAQELAEVFHRFGYQVKRAENIVPIAVAVDGKPAIAAYMNSVLDIPLREVASRMDISYKSAYQYVDHFKEGRR